MAEENKKIAKKPISINDEIFKLKKNQRWLINIINDILGNNGDDFAPVVRVYRGVTDRNSMSTTKMIAKKHETDSCYDICAHFPNNFDDFKKLTENNPKLEDTMNRYNFEENKLTLGSLETVLIPTNISVELPTNVECQCRPRSGLSSTGVSIGWGTVDEGYRGEIMIIVTNTTKDDIVIENNSRIAQLAFQRKTIVKVIDGSEDELNTETDRGTSGFGSTGN